MSKRPTIRDISEVVGISTYSVSQALAGKPGVAEATRQRVREVAAELGYLPNRVAANLKDATTSAVGVLTANGLNQYYAVLVQSIDVVLQQHGFHAISNDSMRMRRYAPEIELAGVQELLQQQVAAVIATYSLSAPSLDLLEKWNVPIIFVDSLPPRDRTNHPFVGIDNYAASADVANYLADLGHDSAVYLAYPVEWNTRQPRQAGFVDTCRSRGVEVNIVESDNSAEAAMERTEELLGTHRKTWPTAIYATNTVLLQGALKALKRRGVSIPADISVVGFDDFDWAELIDPPITVVDQHILDIGAAAGHKAVEAIRRGRLPAGARSEPVLFEAELIVRNSCAGQRRASSRIKRQATRPGDRLL